ncbi:MAG: hypothetical protein KUG77_24650 [Nannocystaceae bacterium]|nr:hypothetical protein [Nannocystaceae bacterium]
MWMGCGGGSDPAGMTGTATSQLTTTGVPPATEGSSGGGSGGGNTSVTDPSTSSGTSASESGSTTGVTEDWTSSSSSGDHGESSSSTGEPVDPPDPLWVNPNLWYSTEDRLSYIELDPADGTVVQLVTSTITTPMIDGQTGITMLESGGLVLSRESAAGTEIYYIAEPPTVAGDIEVEVLGTVPDNLRIEALYTDCEGLVYLMDTGTDVVDTDGNRLIRFTEDYLSGDLSYEVITDLSIGNAPDIDDLGPGIDKDGEVTDGQGFAIDSGTVYDFNYTEGNGVSLGTAGTYGVHVLGGPLFDDDTARLYIFDVTAQLFEGDPATLELSDVLVTGPPSTGGTPSGLSGITGPLTECVTTLPPPG